MKPFRFGVNLWQAASRAAWVDKARKLEALGYAVLSVPDHLADCLAPLPALVSAAEATTHLRIGTYVLNNDIRHPVLVAREAATVDLLTEGRLQLGLGAGFMQAEYDQMGVRFDSGGRRVERLAEAVRIIKGLFTGQPVTFVGHHYHVTQHQLQPLPVQRPHPPLLIGGNGRRLLTKSAEKPRRSGRGWIGVGRAGLNAQEPNKTHAVPEPSMGEGTAEVEAPAFMPGRTSTW
jgi:probable F420-dependent oxidoreductase